MVEYIKDYYNYDNDNDYNNTSIINYSNSDIKCFSLYTLLIIILFISFYNPCFPLIKIFFNSCKEKYNIFKIPVYKIKENDNLLLDECPICLDKFEINDRIISLNCNHKFHKDCLKLWIKKNNTCPQCRENII